MGLRDAKQHEKRDDRLDRSSGSQTISDAKLPISLRRLEKYSVFIRLYGSGSINNKWCLRL